MKAFNMTKHHWNYFLALEKDLEKLSRYIEFSDANLATYSIELAHILLSASSEIDVVMKQLCSLISNDKAQNINHYRTIVKKNIPNMMEEEFSIHRYGIANKPWEKWLLDQNPEWWWAYNKVKHERNVYFPEANLKNTINAMGALLVTTVHYYKHLFSLEAKKEINVLDTTYELKPESSFITLNENYYYKSVVVKSSK